MTDKIHPSWNEHPNLLSELNPEGNKGFTHLGKPVSVLELAAGTGKKLDWKCRTCENNWKATGDSRKNGNGCPACAGQKIHSDGRNSMAQTHPELASEYQGDATKVMAGTNKRLDWKCSTCEHEWTAMGASRVKRQASGCPPCGRKKQAENKKTYHLQKNGSMAETHPELAIEYQGDATKIIAGTNYLLDWKCRTCDHEWKAAGSNRSAGKGCPACSNHVINNQHGRNSMAQTHPELAKEYQGDATKVIAGTNKRLPWKCSTCNHKWEATSNSRADGSGCPVCANRQIHIDGRNSMAQTHPELALEYQGDATKIVAGTNKCISWKCSTCDHEWKVSGNTRVRGRGCPACANHVINNQDGRNSMAQTHPELAKEYQGDATKVIAGNTKKLDWKCSTCDHEWKATGRNRVHNSSGCPACATFGFKPDEPAHYYVHKITSELGNILYYKAGISKGWQRRLSQIRNTLPVHHTIENCEVIPFEVGQDALNLEKTLLRMAAEEGWKAPAQPFDGGHELFTQNPLDIAREKQLLK